MMGLDVIKSARPLISDTAKTKWDDLAFLPMLNDGVQAIYRLRPDLTCVDDTLPTTKPPKLLAVEDEPRLSEGAEMALVFFVAAMCWKDKGASAKTKAHGNDYWNKYLSELGQ